jgi:hypothetical protein
MQGLLYINLDFALRERRCPLVGGPAGGGWGGVEVKL